MPCLTWSFSSFSLECIRKALEMVFEKCPGCGDYLQGSISDSMTQMNSPVFLLFSGKKMKDKKKVRKSILKTPNKMSLKDSVEVWKRK